VSLGFAFAVLNEAALSFLGLGARPPVPAWGVMLSEGRAYLREAPWYMMAPGVTIFLAVLGLNLLGDGIQTLLDPRRPDAGSTHEAAEVVGSKPSSTAVPEARHSTAAQPEHMGLAIRDLTVTYGTGEQMVVGAQGVSLDVHPGEVLALVGESGCGKSTVGLAAAGLIEFPGRITGGSVFIARHDLVTAAPSVVRGLRGAKVAMVFQDPMSSLNPSMTVADQLMEMLGTHTRLSRRAALQRSAYLLEEVGLRQASQVLRLYPHELSGGMCQRVMIAMAISLDPAVLIADEPTTALDVTVQARILRLLASLQKRHGLAVLLITHDLRVAATVANTVAVMYGTLVVEYGRARDVVDRPQHPYTKALVAAIPHGHWSRHRLMAIAGRPPQLQGRPIECPFRDRCPDAFPECGQLPELVPRRTDAEGIRTVRCHLHEPIHA
jgi:peptide/nickel transport system permease protein